MKRIAWIATLGFLCVGAALWVSQSYMTTWEPRLRSELETRAGAALGARVHIERIAFSFIHRIALKDVEIWDNQSSPETLVMRAKEIALTLSLIDLPSAVYHRNPLEVIGLITIDSPLVSMTPEWLARHRPKKSTKHSSIPLWFAVEWNDGTFQWKEAEAPHGAWTLYQSKGHFRIRGPHVDVTARGALEQAESVDLHLTTLGHRWSAQGRLSGGDIPGVIALAKRLTLHSPLPESWKTQGRFGLEVDCSGRWPIQREEGLGRFIQDARLNFMDAKVQPGADAAPLVINGGLVMKSGRLETSNLSIQGDKTQLKISGHATPFAPLPLIDLQAQGHIGRWPLDNVHTQIRKLHDKWEITPTVLRVWDGTLTLKGTLSPGLLDLALTGNELSLQAMTGFHLGQALRGGVNFSLSTNGPPADLRTTGSFWINNFVWAHSPEESVKGQLDVTAAHFSLQGASEDDDVQLRIDGTRSPATVTLQQASLRLREEAAISAHGAYTLATDRLHLSLEAKNVSLADDIPLPPSKWASLKGHADLHGTVDGALSELELKSDVLSQDFQVGASSPTKATAFFRWHPHEFNFEAVMGKAPAPQGWLRFVLRPGNLALQRFSIVTPYGKADIKGTSAWDPESEGRPIKSMTIQGEGRIASLNEGSVWSVPCRFKGHLSPADGWSGEVGVEAPTVRVHKKDSDPFEAQLRWDKTAFKWDSLRWGKNLTSFGALQLGGETTPLTGEMNAHDIDLAVWQGLFWPGVKEPVNGKLNGSFKLGGTLQDPLLNFMGKVNSGRWRAFHFDTGVEGTWKKAGLEPFILNATLQTGGQIHFQGHVSLDDQTASGTLDVTQANLKPIADSLSFPHPLESKTNGTFTVSGPLNQLHFAGHVEGSSLVYGEPTAQPIHLESYVMDMKLEPAPDQSQATRLTITQAVAKTQEEEIRLNPGSFVEFAGLHEAKMQVGAEIRNLHLGVFTLFGGLDMNGTWQIKPQGFAIQSDVITRSLYINDYQLEQGHIQLSYYNRLLSFDPPRSGPALVTGTVDFQHAPQLTFKEFAVAGKEHAGLRLNGQIGPNVWDFTMEGRGLDLSTLGGLSGFPYTLQGTADVKIRGRGDLDHPDVEGTLDVQDGQALALNFQKGSAAFAWRGQRMTFTRLQLNDPGRYNLTGTGVFPLGAKSRKGQVDDKTVDFSIRLVDSNLGLLQSLSREVKHADGLVQALLHITGTSDAPVLRGSIRVKNGDVDGAHYFHHVRDFQLAADFDGDDLVISEFRGKSGKGEFTGGGRISFAGFIPKAYDLHVEVPSAKGIEVVVPELAIPESPLAKKLHFLTTASQGDVKANVTFRGPADAPVFTGKATISNGHFTFPPSSKNPPPPGFLEWVRRITWDTNLHFTDGAWFENELVEANLVGDLSIKGTNDKLKVDGGMDIVEGKISYLGIDFNVRQARYDLRSTETGSTITTIPYVRGLAESQVQTVDPVTGQSVEDTITLNINYAPVNEIKPQLRSSLDPTLTQDKLLARVTQLEVENLTPQERNFMYQQQMVRVIDTSLATPLARNLLKRTGLVDELRVSRVINPAATTLPADPNNPAATQQNNITNLLAGTKYTVAKNISNRMSLGYGLRFEEIQSTDIENKLTNKLDLRSDVELSYRLLSNLYFRGVFDLPTTTPGALPDRKVTIEPRIRFGWWGNTNKPKPKPSPSSTPGTNPPETPSH